MAYKIPFHRFFQNKQEVKFLNALVDNRNYSQTSTPILQTQLTQLLNTGRFHLTSSCTLALEIAIMNLDLKSNDEVILPSFTFMSAANAVIRTGAIPIFADIDPETMNLSSKSLKNSITPNTKAVILMHYAGLSHNPGEIIQICTEHDLVLIEDAAHCIGASFDGKHFGTFGDYGAISFHHTKNIHCGEGGLIICKQDKSHQEIDSILNKGTNKTDFINGLVDAYNWIDMGTSAHLSALGLAFLEAQILHVEMVTEKRRSIWSTYHQGLSQLQKLDISLPDSEAIKDGNGHIFYMHCRSKEERSKLISHLEQKGIQAYFHYPALHESAAGKKYGKVYDQCLTASQKSTTLLRLPIYPDLTTAECQEVIDQIKSFYQ